MNYFTKFYLDKEKDIIINLYSNEENKDELTYIIETPNNKSSNLITNLAKICNCPISYNDKNFKIITGKIPAYLNSKNETVFIFYLDKIHVATIFPDKTIEQKVKISAITKTLMSQTKNYNYPAEKTLINGYIKKCNKFKTDLHTHLYANLSPDLLIALGIKHQIQYPFYFIKKFDLKITDSQLKKLLIERNKIEKKYKNSELKGKFLERKIDDETYINFADFILNNIENAEENIRKIRNNLSLVKDGQAVFTNLEKLYTYRYVYQKGISSTKLINISKKQIDLIPDIDIKEALNQMIIDSKSTNYSNNTLFQDNLLLLAREYQKQNILYSEIALTAFTQKGEKSINLLKEAHEILPIIKEETNVDLRFLAAIRRIWLSQKEQLEATEILKVFAKSPYVVGSDIIGEEITDINDLETIIKDLVNFSINENNGFTIRIHAGENDAFSSNVEKAIDIILKSAKDSPIKPRCRLGHGLYGISDNPLKNNQLMKKIKKANAILEFQLSSNIRLNNIVNLKNHPIKHYLQNNICCVQGTDGFGIYGTDTIEEQLDLQNFLNISDLDIQKMKTVEEKLISENEYYFKIKEAKFNELIKNKSFNEFFLEEETKALEKIIINEEELKSSKLDSKEYLKDKIKELPIDKLPIIIAGGSFNTNGRKTIISENETNILRDLIKNLNENKAYFVIGHSCEGYEKAIIDLSKEYNKLFEIDAIVPKKLNEETKNALLENNINGIRISIESEDVGIYKSFNYEIFERRDSVVLAFDGNSPVSNLIQEAKNGKGKSKIFVNGNVSTLHEKAEYLNGYVEEFSNDSESLYNKIKKWKPNIE